MTIDRSCRTNRLLSGGVHGIVLVGILACASHVSAQAPANGQLHMAVRNRDTTAVKVLLSGGFNPDRKDSDGLTPRQRLEVFAAAMKKDPTHTGIPVRAAALRKSIDTGIADINDVDVQGFTPLQLAASFGFDEIVEILLAKGAELNPGGRWNLTSLQGMEDFQNLSTPLGLAAQTNQVSTVKLLLARGAYPNGVKTQEMSPLQEAALKKNYDMVKLLLDNGASATSAHWVYGVTALHTAAQVGDLRVVALLLDKGADVNAGSRYLTEGTPLQMALRARHMEVVQLMEKHFLKYAETNPGETFTNILAWYRKEPTTSLQRLLLQLGGQVQPPPVVPEDAREHYVAATTIGSEAHTEQEEAIAIKHLQTALHIAPWWNNPYFYLASTYALIGRPDEAEEVFRLYLLSNPGEERTRDVKDRIYAIRAKRQLATTRKIEKDSADRLDAVQFSWLTGDWTLKFGGLYAKDPDKTVSFARRGNTIIDTTGNLGISAKIGANNELEWGRVFDMDHCGLKGRWHATRVTFTNGHKSARIIFPLVGLKCEIEYNEAMTSATLTRR